MKKIVAGFIGLALVLSLVSAGPAQEGKHRPASTANRWAYLDELDLYYPDHGTAKFTTPQWIGEPGVEAVVVFAIDDMRDPAKYEAFLRPILRRLQQIDSRAPVSIMTCNITPKDPQIQSWLREGLSIECHTIAHPCPFFKIGFPAAKKTYDDCVDQMASIPNNRPVAFRMPCCDSLNTPSPRFFSEIMNRTTAGGNFLSLDSSVFTVFTEADPELPRSLLRDDQGRERFRRYLPADRSFVNIIENYPYPYRIGPSVWQLPCMTPSDWQAQHLQKPNNPRTVEDWKIALDLTVIKKGVFNVVFHPHGWIKSEQVVDFIDHAVQKHGKKVKFLTFREVHDRLHQTAGDGDLSGRSFGSLVDLDGDGYMDVWRPRAAKPTFSVWQPKEQTWKSISSPAVEWGDLQIFGAKLGFPADAKTPVLVNRYFGAPASPLPVYQQAWSFAAGKWSDGLKTWKRTDWLDRDDAPPAFFFLRDIDGDGVAEAVYPSVGRVISPAEGPKSDFANLPKLPSGRSVGACVEAMRLIDLDGDGKLDVVFSDETEFGIYLFADRKSGWSKTVTAGKQGGPGSFPPVARGGADNGFFVRAGHMWWSNEDTALLKDHVDRRNIAELLKSSR